MLARKSGCINNATFVLHELLFYTFCGIPYFLGLFCNWITFITKALFPKVFFTCNVYFRKQWFSAQSADHGQISISRWEQIYFFHLFFTEKFGADTLIYKSTELSTEAVVRRCSVKKMFLKISQNSQENTCVRVSFLIKLWILRNF